LVVRLGGLSGVSWEVDMWCSEAVVGYLAVVERGVDCGGDDDDRCGEVSLLKN
jgi:hypothetical protein